MSKLLSHMSVVLNGWLTGETGKPLCYTAYERKSKWYKFFDTAMFWDRQHCRKVWLSRRLHDQPQVFFNICRADYKTEFEWNNAIADLDKVWSGPAPEGFHWVKEEQYRWTPNEEYHNSWKIRLLAVRDKHE